MSPNVLFAPRYRNVSRKTAPIRANPPVRRIFAPLKTATKQAILGNANSRAVPPERSVQGSEGVAIADQQKLRFNRIHAAPVDYVYRRSRQVTSPATRIASHNSTPQPLQIRRKQLLNKERLNACDMSAPVDKPASPAPPCAPSIAAPETASSGATGAGCRRESTVAAPASASTCSVARLPTGRGLWACLSPGPRACQPCRGDSGVIRSASQPFIEP